jgi:hypothetical protein
MIELDDQRWFNADTTVSANLGEARPLRDKCPSPDTPDFAIQVRSNRCSVIIRSGDSFLFKGWEVPIRERHVGSDLASAVLRIEARLGSGFVYHTGRGFDLTRYLEQAANPRKAIGDLPSIPTQPLASNAVASSTEKQVAAETIDSTRDPRLTQADQPGHSTFPEARIREVLDAWVESFRTKDATRHVDCYAPVIEKYFLQSNVSHDQLRRYKEAAFQRISEVHQYEIADVTINREAVERYSARFIKTWSYQSMGGSIISGKEIQQLEFGEFESQWKITREEEAKVFHAEKSSPR